MFDIEHAVLFLIITIPLSIGALYIILNCLDNNFNNDKDEGGN